jgi:hypothetical protein
MGAVRAIRGHVDDAEPDFRLGPAWAATSKTVTLGEPVMVTHLLHGTSGLDPLLMPHLSPVPAPASAFPR